jgi:hypothetical protein
MTESMRPRVDLPAVRTDADLQRHWTAMMGPGGFAYSSLWTIWFDDEGASLPLVVPLDDVPEHPDDQLVDNLMLGMRQPLDASAATSLAMLLSRPGGASMRPGDRAWARALIAAAQRHQLTMWPVHLATHGRVRAFRPDDLVADQQ